MTELGSQPEVDELGGAAGDEDVLGFQIAMGKALLVDRLDRVENRRRQLAKARKRHAPRLLHQHVGQRFEREVFHCDVELFADRSPLVHDRRERRAGSFQRGALAHESLGGAKLLRGCDFDGNRLPGGFVHRPIHDAKPALAENPLDAKSRQLEMCRCRRHLFCRGGHVGRRKRAVRGAGGRRITQA